LQNYFSGLDEGTIKENFSTIYQLLEEMCDNGFPMVTELNALQEMIAPPSISNRIVAAVSGRGVVAEELPVDSGPNLPWRKRGVHYNVNSIYFDIIEEIDCTIGNGGEVVSCEIRGMLQCNSKLSRNPDVSVSFNNGWLIEDFTLHPCARISRFERERVLSFVPPDGPSTLMKYRVDPTMYTDASSQSQRKSFSKVPIPIYCRPQLSYSATEGMVEIMVGTKPVPGVLDLKKLDVDDICVVIPLPKGIRSTDLKSNHGSVMCDDLTKVCRWKIGKLPGDRHPNPKLTGTFTYLPGSPQPDEALTLLLEFKLTDSSVSGLTVSNIHIYNETYEPYKYVRSIVKAGSIQIRT